jgi:hypothetical protein
MAKPDKLKNEKFSLAEIKAAGLKKSDIRKFNLRVDKKKKAKHNFHVALLLECCSGGPGEPEKIYRRIYRQK